MFTLRLEPGPVEVVLKHPVTGQTAGRWRFADGGHTLEIDFLGDAAAMCRVDGREADDSELPESFVAWPRMTFEVGGRPVTLVAREPEVLRRHYSRPQHQEAAYAPSTPNPYVEAFHQARIGQVRRLLAGVRGRVLDVGSGYSLIVMAGPWTQFEIFACDRDPEAVRVMLKQGRAKAVIGSVEAVPFRPGSFDAVFAGEIVEHLIDPEHALREWISALRPGGRLILTTPNREHLMARLRDQRVVKNPEHLFEYSRKELVAAVEAAGGRVSHVEGLQMPIPVWMPRKGWRDALNVRFRRPIPVRLYAASVKAGRWFPGISENLAIVAVRSA